MKQRSADYINSKKARNAMCHPGDLKTFLIAGFDSSQNLVVKKDILKLIDSLDQQQEADTKPVL